MADRMTVKAPIHPIDDKKASIDSAIVSCLYWWKTLDWIDPKRFTVAAQDFDEFQVLSFHLAEPSRKDDLEADQRDQVQQYKFHDCFLLGKWESLQRLG